MKFDETRMRRACTAAASTLKAVGGIIRPGMTTAEINEFVRADTVKQGGYPAPHNYKGFPGFCCTSVNDVVCHGIPGPYVLKLGDVLNVDVTTVIDGHFGDTNATFIVGEDHNGVYGPTSSALVECTRDALAIGVAEVGPGRPLRHVGAAIDAHVKLHGFTVVREFGGHGVNTLFHTVPHVCHYLDVSDDTILVPGMTFTIEPIVCDGNPRFKIEDDGWTARTLDGSNTAQFEHTLLVTNDGCEVLTFV